MTTDQVAITQAFTQAAGEAMKAAVQAMAVAASKGSSGARSEPTRTGPKIVGLTLRQPTFDLDSTDKHLELRNFRLKVNNILQSYNVNNTKNINYVKVA